MLAKHIFTIKIADKEQKILAFLIKFSSSKHSILVPPDPMPNSEVKRYCADGSVGLPHVRVGHC